VLASLFVAGELLLEHVGEKEKPEDGKHDEQLDKNDDP